MSSSSVTGVLGGTYVNEQTNKSGAVPDAYLNETSAPDIVAPSSVDSNAINAWWTPVDPAPHQRRPTPGILFPAAPPFPPSNVNIATINEAIGGTWIPDPVDYEFVGGKAPYMPRRLPAAVVAVAQTPVVPDVSLVALERPWDSWWIPADPAPQLTVKTPQGPPGKPTVTLVSGALSTFVGGVYVNESVNLSGGLPGSLYLDETSGPGDFDPPDMGQIYPSFEPDARPYQFFGGTGPYLPRYLATPAIPTGGLGRAQANVGLYASFPADVTAITWVQLDPELISPPTPPPPPPVLPALAQIQRTLDPWWVPPDPLPQLQALRPQPAIAAPILAWSADFYAALPGEPPPDYTPWLRRAPARIFPQPFLQSGLVHNEAIQAAWVPADPQPQRQPGRARLPAQFLVPFVPPRALDVVAIAAAWAPDPPVAQRRPSLVQVAVPDTVLVGIDVDVVIAAWAPEPFVQQPRARLITLPGIVPQARVSTEVILSAWEPAPPPAQAALPRLVQVPVPYAIPARIDAGIAIAAAWVEDYAPLPGKKIPPHTAAVTLSWFPVPSGAQNAVVAAWQPSYSTALFTSIVAQAVEVDSPPIIGVFLDNLATALTFWVPSAFDPWFTAPLNLFPNPPPTPPPTPGSLIREALHAPHELGSTLRAGIGALSRS